MRTATGLPALFSRRRAVALAAGAGCVVVMAMSGGAVASASAASPSSRVAAAAPQAVSVPPTSWANYLLGPLHHSYAPLQTAITPGNASTLVQKWSQAAGAPFVSSPIVNNGSVYVGGGDGYFYRLSESTGAVLAKTYLGSQPATTCPYALGVSSTATIMLNKYGVLTVYVSGGDGYLYALRALTLKQEWRSVIAIPRVHVDNYYDWSSPTVANGKIYIGIASSCDQPLIRGAVVAYSQSNGAKLAEFFTTPSGPANRGATVWSSVAVAPSGYLFVTTGNGPVGRPRLANAESILKLNPNTLALVGSYKIPAADVRPDSDFGASPVIFGRFVGACNKNGYFYALRQSNMTLAWKVTIGHVAGPPRWGECIATPVDNGKDLYFGANMTPPGVPWAPVQTLGSVQERSTANGALIWATPLNGGVLGSPTMDGAGVLAVGTQSLPTATNGLFLIDAANGSILSLAGSPIDSPITSGMTFGQSVFAENEIFTDNSNGIFAFGLPG